MSNRRVVTFEQIPGRQFLNGVEYRSLCHHSPAATLVTISSDLPINEQLALAAESAVEILHREDLAAAMAKLKSEKIVELVEGPQPELPLVLIGHEV